MLLEVCRFLAMTLSTAFLISGQGTLPLTVYEVSFNKAIRLVVCKPLPNTNCRTPTKPHPSYQRQKATFTPTEKRPTPKPLEEICRRFLLTRPAPRLTYPKLKFTMLIDILMVD